MGFVVIIIIIFIVIGIYQAYKDGNSTNSSTYNSNRTYNTSRTPASGSSEYEQSILGYKIKSLNSKNRVNVGRLSISAKLEKLVFEQSPFAVLKLFATGSMKVPFAGYPAVFLVELKDLTNNDSEIGGLVMCSLKDLCYNDSKFFQHVSDVISIPYRDSTVSNMNILNIPLEALTFPRKGNITLEFSIKLISGDNLLTDNKFYLSFYNPKDGYLDSFDAINNFYKYATNLLETVILIDGKVDPSEVKLLKEWIEKNSTEFVKSELLISVENLQKDPELKTNDELVNDAKAICLKIAKEIDLARRYELLEILIRMISIDGSIDTKEKDLIDMIANNLDISMTRFLELYQKHMPSGLAQQSINLKTLGITEEMDIVEKKEILRKEYMKWNKKVISSNEDTRKKANVVLRIIAEERAKLDSIMED